MKNKFSSFYIAALAVAGIGLVGTSFVPKAQADVWDKMTIVTINERILAGDKVLEPGTYVWKLQNSQADRHIVQIFDKDQRHLEQTILAIPNYRLQPTGDSRFAFWETPAGVPKAVRAWFYPGDNFGQEFTYPKKLVAQLAAAVPVPIPTSYKEPEPTPEPAPVAAEPAPAPEPAPQAQPAPAAQPAPQPPASTPDPSSVTPMTSLPHTGSSNPLIGLLGLSALSLAGLLTLVQKRA